MSFDKITPRAPNDELFTCAGKCRFANKADALASINRPHRKKSGKRKWHPKVRLSPYRCPHCHFWHVGGHTD